MNPRMCALLITTAGAVGGVVNALLTDNGFALPRRISGVWCPGAISNILVGAFAAFSSWAFYGSGASVELADKSARAVMSLRFSALAGAFLVGVAGAKWITNEVDKRLLKKSVRVAAKKTFTSERSEHITGGSPRQVLEGIKKRMRTVRIALAVNSLRPEACKCANVTMQLFYRNSISDPSGRKGPAPFAEDPPPLRNRNQLQHLRIITVPVR